ncbi:MAG: hypothetical protein ABSA51_06980 [Anaerolineaceae bacterium]|jgi:hypothetical protein
MATQFDEHGKIFTNVVSKKTIRAKIQTASNHIIGDIYIRQDGRLSDELNKSDPFLPVTNVEIRDVLGKNLIENRDFIAIQKSQIIWVSPDSEEPDSDIHKMVYSSKF